MKVRRRKCVLPGLLVLLLAWLPLQFAQAQELTLSTDAVSPQRFIAVHGRRSLIDGYADRELEVWAYPLQLIRGYRIGFVPDGSSTEIEGGATLRRIVYRPESVTRIYVGPNFVVRETLTVPLDRPAATITYTVESQTPVDIVVHFAPVLNLMWPAAIGGQDISWSTAASGYVMAEATHQFSAVVGSKEVVAHDAVFNRAEAAGRGMIAFTIRPQGKLEERIATVVVASVSGGKSGLITAVKKLSDSRKESEMRAVQHYEDLRSEALEIKTPDATLNRDLAWSEIALDQAWVCNPDLGCGLVAGYGPSRGARRPQYAWFFAGDAMVAVRALLSAGEFERARDALEFITKYQDPKTGMIWHEMSQSAGLLDWSGKYPYMFVHVDISFQYLNTVREYVESSGDTAFLKDHWKSVDAAYRYCESLIDRTDGLPRIPPDKEGGDEQDRMSDELTLSTSWATAADSYSKMAALVGEPAGAAEAASVKARKAISQRYWDVKQNFWIDGYAPGGGEILNRSSRGNEALAQHVFSEAQEQKLLDTLASSNFQTDWGTRSNALNSRNFNPNSYATGSVWAVGTANLAEDFWAAHRPNTALPIWDALVPWASLDSLGHMDEVLAGDFYHEQTESVPEQTWSSAVFLHAAVQGLLGIQVDGLTRQVQFAPHLPSDWSNVTVTNVAVAGSKIAMTWKRTDAGSTLEIENGGPSFHLLYSPEIPQGARLTVSQWNGIPVRIRLEKHEQDSHATVVLDVPHGIGHLVLGYEGGVSLILPKIEPLVGNASRAMRITSTVLRGDTYIVQGEAETGSASSFELQTTRKLVAVRGATWKASAAGTYMLTVAPSASENEPSEYRAVEIVIHLAPIH